MRQKLFIGVYIGILALFVLICALFVVELSRSSAMSKEIQSLQSRSDSSQLQKLQSDLDSEKQSNSQLSSSIGALQKSYDQLQNNYNDLQQQVTKIQQTKAQGTVNGKVAYLTFDDGPSPLTPKVLDVLKQNNLHATFFVVGTCAQDHPDFVKRAYNEGNVIGIHSWTHDYSYIYKNETNFFDDFNKLKDYLHDLLGVFPTVCRYPGGTNNTVSQHYSDHIMQKVDPQVKATGIKPYDWNAYAGDAESGPKPSADKIVQNVLSSAGPKTLVVLMHDTGVNSNDVAALPGIISGLRARGYTFGTLTPFTPDMQFKPYGG